jgi:oxygen-independent coproporphyrinogen-3 oxidase
VFSPPLALYVHIPFCRTRCTYCAFNTYAGLSGQIAAYMQALWEEIGWVTESFPRRPAQTIYFGGGTPSLIPAPLIQAVIQRCAERFVLAAEPEITLEANPGTVDRTYLQALHDGGVNRLSIGMQSAHQEELQLFGRRHSVDAVRQTVQMARTAGFHNVSLDLIYGAPRQTLLTWRLSLETALEMEPDHLSLYSLGLEEGTPMQHQVVQGQLPAPDPDLAADMYEWASERLAAAGFEQYEISNWARPGFACHHNLHYWRNLPYLGFGAGAHGYAAQTRYANVLHPEAYIERIQSQAEPLPFPLSAAAEEIEPLDAAGVMAESMLMGLRLTGEGVAPGTFRARYGHDLWSVYGSDLDRLIGWGLLERLPDSRIRLTRRGRLLGNIVFEAFV